jgi:hypothetical protein
MELPVVSALEFEQIRSSIKTFIKTKTDFTDYDFEGSNLSMLVDILAYNTLYTSYNVNMASNELNLDTAVLRDNVVSIAKRLGYTPSSYTSSKVRLNVLVNDTNNLDKIIVTKGPILAASASGKSFIFIIRDDLEVDVRGKTSILFNNIESVEGSDFSITYTVDESNEHQRFFIPNNFVDSETIRAFVIPDTTSNFEEEYERRNTIVDVDASSKIFFVEEVQDQKYEVIFGDDVFGRKLRSGEIVRLQYVVSSGGDSNNIRESQFNFVGKIFGVKEGIQRIIEFANISYEVISDFSDGGSEFESIESIKYAAPRYYASQERAVTIDDYESIIRQIYPNTKSVTVAGGEALSIPQYGKIFITIKPIVGDKVSDGEKQRIKTELKKYQVGSIAIELLDPDVLSIHATPVVIYDKNKTRKSESDLTSDTNQKVLDYSLTPNFDKFNGLYSNSKLSNEISTIDSAVEFVRISPYLVKKKNLIERIPNRYVVDFNTKLRSSSKYPYYVFSEPFCASGIQIPVFLGAPANCDYSGDLNLYSVRNEYIKTVGTVNSRTGKVEFFIEACQSATIDIVAIPDVTEVPAGPNTTPKLLLDDILILDPDDALPFLDPDDIPNLPYPPVVKLGTTGDPTVSGPLLPRDPTVGGPLLPGGITGGGPLLPRDPTVGGPLLPGGTTLPVGGDLLPFVPTGDTIFRPGNTTEDSDGNQIAIPTNLTPGVGGYIPYTPSIPPSSTDTTPTVRPLDPTGGIDPNDINTIENFTPEIDPTVCS